jgi:uncharacterized protein
MVKLSKLLMLMCMLLAFASVPASADNRILFPKTHVIDSANLLTASEVSLLENRLAEISRNRGNDAVIITATDIATEVGLGSRARSILAREDYRNDAVVIVVNVNPNLWDMYTFGFSNGAFTNRGINKLADDIQPFLAAGDFFAAFISLVIVMIMKSSHKTSKPQRSACNYIIQNSLNMTNKEDLYLYTNVTKTAIPKNTGSGGGGGGRLGGRGF